MRSRLAPVPRAVCVDPDASPRRDPMPVPTAGRIGRRSARARPGLGTWQIQLTGTLDTTVDARSYIADVDDAHVGDPRPARRRPHRDLLLQRGHHGAVSRRRRAVSRGPALGAPLSDYPDERWIDVRDADGSRDHAGSHHAPRPPVGLRRRPPERARRVPGEHRPRFHPRRSARLRSLARHRGARARPLDRPRRRRTRRSAKISSPTSTGAVLFGPASTPTARRLRRSSARARPAFLIEYGDETRGAGGLPEGKEPRALGHHQDATPISTRFAWAVPDRAVPAGRGRENIAVAVTDISRGGATGVSTGFAGEEPPMRRVSGVPRPIARRPAWPGCSRLGCVGTIGPAGGTNATGAGQPGQHGGTGAAERRRERCRRSGAGSGGGAGTRSTLAQIAAAVLPGPDRDRTCPNACFRLTRTQLDITTKTLLPQAFRRRRRWRPLPRDPLQTNYEYADNLGFNPANFTPYTNWVDADRRQRQSGARDASSTARRAATRPRCLGRSGQEVREQGVSRGGVRRAARALCRLLHRQRDRGGAAERHGGSRRSHADLAELRVPRRGADRRHGRAPARAAAAEHHLHARRRAARDGGALLGDAERLPADARARRKRRSTRCSPRREARAKLLRFFVAWLEVKEPDEFTIATSAFPEFTPEVAAAVVGETKTLPRAPAFGRGARR